MILSGMIQSRSNNVIVLATIAGLVTQRTVVTIRSVPFLGNFMYDTCMKYIRARDPPGSDLRLGHTLADGSPN